MELLLEFVAGPEGPVIQVTAWLRFLQFNKSLLSRTESTGHVFLFVLMTRRSSVQI
jgi:hypothetical protein